jgi:hypothetical protein
MKHFCYCSYEIWKSSESGYHSKRRLHLYEYYMEMKLVKEIDRVTVRSDNEHALILSQVLVSGIFDLNLTVLPKFPCNICAAVGTTVD